MTSLPAGVNSLLIPVLLSSWGVLYWIASQYTLLVNVCYSSECLIKKGSICNISVPRPEQRVPADCPCWQVDIDYYEGKDCERCKTATNAGTATSPDCSRSCWWGKFTVRNSLKSLNLCKASYVWQYWVRQYHIVHKLFIKIVPKIFTVT